MKPASLASLASLVLVAACGASSPSPSSPSNTDAPPALPTTGPEGLRGTITILTGDFMPPGPSTGGAAPSASAPVHVFAGTLKPITAIDPAAPAYRGKAITDASGRYQVALPPGVYTVLIESGGVPYRNCYDGDGTWCTFTVTAGQWTDADVEDNSGATY